MSTLSMILVTETRCFYTRHQVTVKITTIPPPPPPPPPKTKKKKKKTISFITNYPTGRRRSGMYWVACSVLK